MCTRYKNNSHKGYGVTCLSLIDSRVCQVDGHHPVSVSSARVQRFQQHKLEHCQLHPNQPSFFWLPIHEHFPSCFSAWCCQCIKVLLLTSKRDSFKVLKITEFNLTCFYLTPYLSILDHQHQQTTHNTKQAYNQ